MSIPVDVADLAATMADFDMAYLLTASGDGRVKAVSVRPALLDGRIHLPGPGRGSLANLARVADATLLLPPLGTGGLTLLVDGTAVADGDDILLTPTSAILHKAAS